MRPILRMLFIIGAIAGSLPLAILAEDAAAPSASPAQAEKTPPAAVDTQNITSVTGKIVAVGKKAIEIERMGAAPDPETPLLLRLEGGADVPVSGSGKSRWELLRKGDLVAVAYTKTDPPRVAKVLVLPMTAHPLAAAALGHTTSQQRRQREFTGWIKQKHGDILVVRTPDAMAPASRQGQVKEFVRHEGTVVGMGRDSWKELKKGDRVRIEFSKGNPRPADRIFVVLRGGEKPLPPGLATRLFDRHYDRSVRDVDGIGEIAPGQPWKPSAPPPTPSPEAAPTAAN